MSNYLKVTKSYLPRGKYIPSLLKGFTRNLRRLSYFTLLPKITIYPKFFSTKKIIPSLCLLKYKCRSFFKEQDTTETLTQDTTKRVSIKSCTFIYIINT